MASESVRDPAGTRGAWSARLPSRCRRGMRELDQLLVRWLERDAPAASAAELAGFEALLEAEDSDLWRWVTGRAEPARADWQALIARIRCTD